MLITISSNRWRVFLHLFLRRKMYPRGSEHVGIPDLRHWRPIIMCTYGYYFYYIHIVKRAVNVLQLFTRFHMKRSIRSYTRAHIHTQHIRCSYLHSYVLFRHADSYLHLLKILWRAMATVVMCFSSSLHFVLSLLFALYENELRRKIQCIASIYGLLSALSLVWSHFWAMCWRLLLL